MNSLVAWSITAECLIVMVMLISGCAKILAPTPFHLTLEMIPWLPKWAVPIIGYGVPVAEMAVAITLFSSFDIAGLIGAISLFTVFSVPVIWAVTRGQRIRCSCFGPLSDTRFGVSSIIRLVVLAGVALVPLITGNSFSLAMLQGPTLFFGFATAGSMWLIAILASSHAAAIKASTIQIFARGK